MTTTEAATRTTQVFRVFIKASPERIWEAITTPEWAERYGYRSRTEYDLRPGGAYKAYPTADMLAYGAPEVVVDGEVIEADPPNRLVQTYRFRFSPEMEEEGFTTVTWIIEAEPGTDGLSRLTVSHDVTDAPITAHQIAGEGKLVEGGGGWSWILSDLKTLLETGDNLGL